MHLPFLRNDHSLCFEFHTNLVGYSLYVRWRPCGYFWFDSIHSLNIVFSMFGRFTTELKLSLSLYKKGCSSGKWKLSRSWAIKNTQIKYSPAQFYCRQISTVQVRLYFVYFIWVTFLSISYISGSKGQKNNSSLFSFCYVLEKVLD